MEMMMSRKNLVLPLILLILILVASHGRIDAKEDTVVQVGSVDASPCGEEIRCLARCFSPGKCNQCCKNNGYSRGKCKTLACFCCNE
ncbi:hypothetical protein EJB05_06078 [Eragrostis curvula]|uniref:Knottin scorpion toxin-like domain-containing protein n=1 Tax=Eragrostis curvula TaxID=38414 RepID=A0A5J9WFA2_9POAL|nr:hypothetical protein EJB05_06078 [Eragrostis curvula]